jgi:putative transcriptional regulator
MNDPNFDRTVLLMIEHSEQGALGVVLNRPSNLDVGDPLPSWGALAAEPGVVFVGGPVSPDAALVVGRVVDPAFGRWSPVVEDVGVLDVGIDPDELQGHVDGVRIFAGYAGWSPGQLEAEITAGAWFVADAFPHDVLAIDPIGLWADVLHRAGEPELLATHPPQPWLN